jgi:hypothetical protein
MSLISNHSKLHLGKRYSTMVIHKFSKLDKITFDKWVDKALNQSLTKQNIKGVKAHYGGHFKQENLFFS